MLNIISKSKNFHKFYLYAKKLDEPIYQYFIDNWPRRGEDIGFDLLEYSSDINDIIDLNFVDQSIQKLRVFDDIVCERNLDKVSELFFAIVKVIAQ